MAEIVIREKYFAFYLSKEIWIINGIQLEAENIASNFTQAMSEEVFKHETSKYILKFCRDGMFLLKIKSINNEKLESKQFKNQKELNEWRAHLNLANTIALLFESAFLKVENIYNYFSTHEITIRDASWMLFINGVPSDSFITSAEKFQLSRYSEVDILNPFFLCRYTIPKVVLEKTVNDLNVIYEDPWLVSLLSEFLKSISEFKIANFNTALVLAWFIVESILNCMWRAGIQLDEVKNKYSECLEKDKKDPIGVLKRMKILKADCQLSQQWFKKLDKVRIVRNKVAHDGYQCSCQQAEGALINTNEFIAHYFNLHLKVDLTLRYHKINFDEFNSQISQKPALVAMGGLEPPTSAL